jgi:hypothetical protein
LFFVFFKFLVLEKQAALEKHNNEQMQTSNNEEKKSDCDAANIEYASFRIKPSHYKQTGIFQPVNNNHSNGHSVSMGSPANRAPIIITNKNTNQPVAANGK